jgi:hypothetical protein
MRTLVMRRRAHGGAKKVQNKWSGYIEQLASASCLLILLSCASITSSELLLLPSTWAVPLILEVTVNRSYGDAVGDFTFSLKSLPGASLASTCGSDVVLLSLVDPTAPFVPVSCNDDTITAICFAPRCLEVIAS